MLSREIAEITPLKRLWYTFVAYFWSHWSNSLLISRRLMASLKMTCTITVFQSRMRSRQVHDKKNPKKIAIFMS